MKSVQERVGKVRGLAGQQAAECFEVERKNRDGELKKHYQYAKEMSSQTLSMSNRDCQGGDGKHWWCFHGTPTMVVFVDEPPTGAATQNLQTVEPHDRWLYVNPCLTASP
jgi:hypothetical protein